MTFTINNTAFPIPAGWSESYETVENVNQSEAGTDLCSLVRANKLVLNINTNVTASQKATLKALAAEPTVTVAVDGASKIMRMRDFSANFVRYSDRLQTEELWECAYTLTEV